MHTMATSFYIRELEERDLKDAAIVCYEAFGQFHEKQFGVRLDFPSIGIADLILHHMFSTPKVYAVVAVDKETEKIIGSNFIDIRDEVAGIGPISVQPSIQAKGIGHALMTAVIEHALKNNFKSIRLTQEVYNTVSFSLYNKIGFVSQEQISDLRGKVPAYNGKLIVRLAKAEDAYTCDEIHKVVVGSSRLHDITESLTAPNSAFVATTSEGDIIGFTVGFSLLGFTVVLADQGEEALHALFHAYSKVNESTCIRIPGRLYPNILRKALAEWGLKFVRNLTLMSYGEFQVPSSAAGMYFNGILY